MLDLHAHTTASDGTDSPAELVRRAAEAGVETLAVTDHDTLAGLPEARKAAAEVGIAIVPGIELSCEHPVHGEFHLLGYFIDDAEGPLAARLAELRLARRERAARIVERLREAGVDVALADVQAAGAARADSAGRPHVARALVAKGVVASVNEAFERFLGEGRPGYVPKAKLDGGEAIALVRSAGGVAVLAHPGLLGKGALEPLVAELAAEGLDGIEVVYPRHDAAMRARLASLAREHGLVPTGGTDYHGENKPDIKLGTGVDGNVRVGGDVLDALRSRVRGGPRSSR